MKRFASLLSTVLLLWSCSIKENRADCPCLLELTLSGGKESIVQLSLWNHGKTFSDELYTGGKETCVEYSVARGLMTVVAGSGIRHTLSDSGELLLGRGEQMDEIFAASGIIDTRAETVSGKVELMKQFAVLNLRVDMLHGRNDFAIRLRGDVAGMNMLSLNPVPGNFEVEIHPVVDDYCRVVLPRQTAGSRLLLDVGEGNEIDLGGIIAESGYDWSAPSLDDIYVHIDFVCAGISVCVIPWDGGAEMSVDY